MYNYSKIGRPLVISIDSVLVLWLQCTLAGTLSTFHTHPPSMQVVASVVPSDVSLLTHYVRDCAILHKQKS